jgi:hypothetical protein
MPCGTPGAPGHTPARATVEAKLAAPQYKVEIMGGGGALRCEPMEPAARSRRQR